MSKTRERAESKERIDRLRGKFFGRDSWRARLNVKDQDLILYSRIEEQTDEGEESMSISWYSVIESIIFVFLVILLPGEVETLDVLLVLILLYLSALARPSYNRFLGKIFYFIITLLVSPIPGLIGILIGAGAGWLIITIRGIEFNFQYALIGAASGLLIASYSIFLLSKFLLDRHSEFFSMKETMNPMPAEGVIMSLVYIISGASKSETLFRKSFNAAKVFLAVAIICTIFTTASSLGFGGIGLLMASFLTIIWSGSYIIIVFPYLYFDDGSIHIEFES